MVDPMASLGRVNLDFSDKRVTVVGLGIEGVDLVRFLARRGAYITVSDSKSREKLADQIEQVADLPVRFSLGANNPQDMVDADALFVSQGVPLDLPGIVAARRQGVPLWSMLALFMELCSGPIVGITGSSGKTTTTALVGEMFRSAGRPHFVGGNIGVGLLDHLTEIRPYTWVILEISHTQLQLVRRSPHVGAVLNITPNHLDRFTWEEYWQLKANILRYQGPTDWAILNYDDPEARSLGSQAKGETMFFTLSQEASRDAVYVRDRRVFWKHGRGRQELFNLESLQLRGRHNQANALAAAAVACACGIEGEAAVEAVANFRSVEHRLEFVATVNGVDYYNDSIATTPERTLAGLRAIESPVVLLLGGRDKHLPLEELAEESCRRCRAVIFFGESGPILAEAVESTAARLPLQQRPALVRVSGLAQAIEAAHAQAQPGDVVLLSPAGTSFDAYDNFAERGKHFRRLVLAQVREAAPSLL